jgi:hypothetical protein
MTAANYAAAADASGRFPSSGYYDESYPPSLWAPPPPPTATGAAAGTPGTWTPQGANVPADRAALATVTATPATLWTVGQYVVTFDLAESHWNGTAWAANRAPAPPATGATAGTPGTYTPAGSAQPANGAAIAALTASPQATWTQGQYVAAVNADERFWGGTVASGGAGWLTGRAPGVATGAAAGNPGTFTPPGSVKPLTSEMSTVTASPATAWTTGQHVITRDGDDVYWDGAAWVAGVPADVIQTRSAKRKPTT